MPIAFVLFALVMTSRAAYAEWALYSAIGGAPAHSQGVPTIWIMSKTLFTEEGKCRTAAQAITREQQVPTRCVARSWRIYWQSVSKPILPKHPEVTGNIAIHGDEGKSEIQRAVPTADTARVFDSEAECREQLRKIVRAPAPGGDYTCMVETPNWP